MPILLMRDCGVAASPSISYCRSCLTTQHLAMPKQGSFVALGILLCLCFLKHHLRHRQVLLRKFLYLDLVLDSLYDFVHRTPHRMQAKITHYAAWW